MLDILKNLPAFGVLLHLLKTKSGKWRILTDINKVIQLIVLSSLICKKWTTVLVNLKDCFFTITLQVQDKENFVFTLPTYNNFQSIKSYQWNVQKSLNSSTLRKYFMQKLSEIIQVQFSQSIIYYYMIS